MAYCTVVGERQIKYQVHCYRTSQLATVSLTFHEIFLCLC